MGKRNLSERDICTKFITPAVRGARWGEMSQIREEVSFSKNRILVGGKLSLRSIALTSPFPLSPPVPRLAAPHRRQRLMNSWRSAIVWRPVSLSQVVPALVFSIPFYMTCWHPLRTKP